MKNVHGFTMVLVLISLVGCAPLQYGTFQGHASGVIYDDVDVVVQGPNGPQQVTQSRPVIEASVFGPSSMEQAGTFADHAGNYNMKREVAKTYRRMGQQSMNTAPGSQKANEALRVAERTSKALEIFLEGKTKGKKGKKVASSDVVIPTTDSKPVAATSQPEVKTPPAPAPQASAQASSPQATVPAGTIVPDSALVGDDFFLQFKAGVMNAQDKDQLLAVFNKAAEYAVNDQAKEKVFGTQAAEIKKMTAEEFPLAKDQIVREVDSFRPFLKKK